MNGINKLLIEGAFLIFLIFLMIALSLSKKIKNMVLLSGENSYLTVQRRVRCGLTGSLPKVAFFSDKLYAGETEKREGAD
jgi:hypothetical protein